MSNSSKFTGFGVIVKNIQMGDRSVNHPGVFFREVMDEDEG